MTSSPQTRFRVRAVVFDKDGVLADSEAFNLRSAFEVFASRGKELDPSDATEIVGKHPIDYVPVLAGRFGMGDADQRRLIADQEVIYDRLWREQGRLLDGAREALQAVRRRGLGVGLATSSSRREVDSFVTRFALSACFDVTLTLDDVERAKPDPEIYVSAARLLGVEPGSMLVVEDSEHGVRAAKAAGAPCVAVRTPQVSRDRIGMADAHIDSLHALPALLD